jgi:hypothetical protein
MNKTATAFASLAVVAGITGGATLTAQAHPAHGSAHLAGHHPSSVALTRLHAMLQAPNISIERVTRPNDGGAPTF